MNLSLQELANEYEKSIEVQKNVIKSAREKLQNARKSGDFREIKRLNTILQVLYDEKYELEEKAHKLRNYYS